MSRVVGERHGRALGGRAFWKALGRARQGTAAHWQGAEIGRARKGTGRARVLEGHWKGTAGHLSGRRGAERR